MKKIQYLDYACKIGERVKWENLKKEKFEGIIIRWIEEEDQNPIAVVKLDNGDEMEVVC